MQTFLPYEDFRESVRSLDDKRLGKQRVEAYQIISALTGRPRKDGKPYKGWVNHPCTIMWGGNITALKLYYNRTIEEWVRRGFVNTMVFEEITGKVELPDWLGCEPFHSSHRSNLLRKDPLHYSQFNWDESSGDPYVWMDGDKRWYRQMTGKSYRDYFEINKKIF